MASRIKIKSEYAWEQQSDESKEAYEAFSLYRDLGADYGKRSITEVGKRLSKSMTLMTRWSAKYSWIDRAREYDRHIEDIALKKATKGRAKMRERQIIIGQKLQEIGLKAIDNIAITNPNSALKIIIEGTKLEDKQRTAEQDAHSPTAAQEEENEPMKKLDEVLKEITSAF